MSREYRAKLIYGIHESEWEESMPIHEAAYGELEVWEDVDGNRYLGIAVNIRPTFVPEFLMNCESELRDDFYNCIRHSVVDKNLYQPAFHFIVWSY